MVAYAYPLVGVFLSVLYFSFARLCTLRMVSTRRLVPSEGS
jgi:hypothetical protein